MCPWQRSFHSLGLDFFVRYLSLTWDSGCRAPPLASHGCVDLCLGWLGEASSAGHAVGGLLLGNQALSRARALDLAGEFAAMALTRSLGAWDLEEPKGLIRD